MIQATATLTGTPAEIATILNAINSLSQNTMPAAVVNTPAVLDDEVPGPSPKKGRGRPKKDVAVAAVEEPEIEESEIEESEPEDVESVEDDFEEPAEDDNAVVTPDEQKTLKAALRACSEAKGRDYAAKLLMKYGKTSGHVKRKDLAKLIKALKV